MKRDDEVIYISTTGDAWCAKVTAVHLDGKVDIRVATGGDGTDLHGIKLCDGNKIRGCVVSQSLETQHEKEKAESRQ